jgi:hypothetical protein
MPGSPTPFGFAYFAGVKFAGYTCAAWALNRSFDSKENSVWKVGAARTALGLTVGAAYGGLTILLTETVGFFGNHGDGATLGFLAGLVPVRLAEWSLIIWYFYQRGKPNRFLLLRDSSLGIVWSFILDAIGIYAAFVVPGGIWIC